MKISYVRPHGLGMPSRFRDDTTGRERRQRTQNTAREGFLMVTGDAGTRYVKLLVKKSDNEIIIGYVNLGMKNRISDLVNDSKPFIVLVNAQSGKSENKTFIINKQCILHIEPLEE
jgi:hypothetical protein